MKKVFYFGVLLSIVLGMSGCGGAAYTYHMEPTPVEKGKAKYNVKEVNVNLIAEKEVDGYASTEAMEEMFKEDMIKYLKDNNLYAANGFDIYATVNYQRKFIAQSNSVHLPHFGYDIKVKQGDQLLVSFANDGLTVESGFMRNTSIISKVGSSEINPEDEQKDVDTISRTFVENDIINFGK